MLEKMDVVAIQRQPGPWSIAGYIWAGALTKKRDHSCWQASLGSPTASLGLSNLCPRSTRASPKGELGVAQSIPSRGPVPWEAPILEVSAVKPGSLSRTCTTELPGMLPWEGCSHASHGRSGPSSCSPTQEQGSLSLTPHSP